MRVITKGATDQSVTLYIVDNTTGLPVTSLAYNSSGIDLWYRREGAAVTSITEATQTASGAHSDGGFVHLANGVYRLDLPDAAVASGVDSVTVGGTLTGYTVYPVTIQLVAVNPQSATAFITGVNSLAPPTNWNLASIDSNGRVDVIKIAGTTQTARDIGASVLLSPGTGTGQISLSSGAVTAGTVSDKTGYSLSQSFPSNFSTLAIDVSGRIQVQSGTSTGQISLTSGVADVNVMQFGGSAGTFSGGRPEVNTTHWGGTAVASATPNVNVAQISGDSTAADNAEAFFDGTGYAGTNNVIPTVTTTTNLTNKGDGSGFTAIPWNASWDAEVQSEVDDALIAKGLDHLVFTSVTGTDIADNSIIARMASKSATADWDSFVNTTDSLEAIRDNGGGGGGGGVSWADLVADNDDVAGSFGKAIADILVDTGTSIPDAIADLDTAPTYPPRMNFPPSPGFTTQVSRRADGTYKCTKPIRLTAGDVENVYVFIDMSPLFGANDFVSEVGTAAVSAGSVTQGDDNGPRDTYAVVELSGTADDDCEVTVPVTMVSGTTVDVVFEVEVLE